MEGSQDYMWNDKNKVQKNVYMFFLRKGKIWVYAYMFPYITKRSNGKLNLKTNKNSHLQ